MGIQVVERMGLNADDLIPVTMTMRAANEGRIPIIGAMEVRFSGTDSQAIAHETHRLHHQHIRSYLPVTGRMNRPGDD